jgi:hypothetical protein
MVQAQKPGKKAVDELPFEGMLKEVIRDRFETRLPKAAFKMPFQVGGNRPLDWGQVRRLREGFNIDDLYVVHGTAYRFKGKTAVVMGPQGIGKSTALRALSERGDVEPLEDGYVMIGRDRDILEFKVVTSGLLDTSRRFSRISKSIRACCGYKSAYSSEGDGNFDRARFIGASIHKVTNMLGYIFVRPTGRDGQPKDYPLDRLIHVSHQKDTLTPAKVGDSSYSRIGFGEFMAAVECPQKELIQLPLANRELQRRLFEAMLR